MGLFGKLASNDNISGYKKFENKQGWTNADLLEKLSGVKVSFGEPKMGTIKIMGKDVEAVVYDALSEISYVYVKADEKKIDAGSAPKPGAMGGAMMNALGSVAFGGSDADTNTINRAIDELQGVLEKLLAGETVTESATPNINAADAIQLYMAEKLALSLKDKYSICDESQAPQFYVESNVMDTVYKIMDSNENEIMVIKKKLVAITPEFSVNEGKKEIGHFKKKLSLGRAEINGKIDGKEVQIKGDMFAHAFDITLGGQVIGNVDRAQTVWANCYRISIYDKSMVNAVVAIAVICEAIIRADEKND